MTLRLKTILGIAFIEFFLLIILIGSVLNYMDITNKKSLLEYANTTSSLFATAIKDALLSDDLATLESFVSEILKNNSIVYIKILNSNHTVIAQGGDKLQKKFQADRNLNAIDDNIFDVETSIEEAGEMYGKIQLGISILRLQQSITETRNLGITIGLLEMVLVSLFSFILGQYLTKQLASLRVAAKAVCKGDFMTKVPVRGNDEVTEVAKSFNKMTLALELSEKNMLQYQKELEQVNLNLDEKVKERTEQLTNKNSELTDAYKSLKIAQTQLIHSEKMVSIGQLAAGVAHEVNNPLGFILNNLIVFADYIEDYMAFSNICDQYPQLKAEKKKLDIEYTLNDAQALVKDCIEGVNRIADIVSTLKTFARRDDHNKTKVQLKSCIEQALKICHNQIKYNVEIEKNLVDTPEILANEGKLTQVVVNLLINASQAIPKTSKGKITITTKLDQDNIILELRDTGAGISTEHLKKLFDPFFTTKAQGEGTGLGLAIVHVIIQDHGGTIDVTSKIGCGTTFIVTLPISCETPPTS